MKYHIITYGCQMNHSDSERIESVLSLAGIFPVSDMAKADILIINSCSVRQSAINRIYGQLLNFKKFRKNGKTVLAGCVLEADKIKFKNKFDLIIDIKELTDPPAGGPQKLIEFLKTLIDQQEFKAFGYMDYFEINPQYRSDFSAYIPIMTGCNNFCSYCAVPYTRGREISRPAEEIIAEVKRLVDKGYKEITLLGQNVNSYKSQIPNTKYQIRDKTNAPKGRKNMKQILFPQLLELINDIPGDFWIRFLTSHPKDMSDELIQTMAKCDKICEYIHLPIQAGDDEVLRKMNRHYTATQYLKLIKKIRQAFKLPVAISTDIIVGFPSETKTQFRNTAKIMRKVKYDMAYLAEYSPRPGTAAAKLKDNVPILEKKRRKEFLNEILKKTALANNKKYVGKIVEVLIEKMESAENNSLKKNCSRVIYGKTRTFKNVKIESKPEYLETKFPSGNLVSKSVKHGQFIKVKITKAGPWGLEGEIA